MSERKAAAVFDLNTWKTFDRKNCIYSSSTCNHNTLYAKERVVEYINSKDHLELSYLGEQHTSHENCQSTFGYTDPDNTFIYIVSKLGKLHFIYE